MEIKTKFNRGDEAWLRHPHYGTYHKCRVDSVRVDIGSQVVETCNIYPSIDGTTYYRSDRLMTREEALFQYPIDMQKQYQQLFAPPKLPELSTVEE